MSDTMKRAERLDDMHAKGITEELTLGEAENIVTIWSIFIEHTEGFRYIFLSDIPESVLPFPIEIIKGALNKMEAYYYEQGDHERVKLLELIEGDLILYTYDKEAMNGAISKFNKKIWQDAFIPSLKNNQLHRMERGYLLGGKLWKLSKSRIAELMR
jgi:hypothetical protein